MVSAKRNRTLLVIDDDISILRVFKRIFEKQGYDVVTASSGKEAKSRLVENSFDATLMDLTLPDMNGAELLPLMDKLAPNMVRIVISGLSAEENVSDIRKKGADAFLSKPVQPETLSSILEDKLREKKT